MRKRKLTGLRGHRGGNFLHAVADIYNRGLPGRVEVALPVSGEHPAAFATHGDRQLFSEISRKYGRHVQGKMLTEGFRILLRRVGRKEGRMIRWQKEFFGAFMRRFGIFTSILLVLAAFSGPASQAQAPGTVKLEVDLRDATRRVFHSRMEFPVSAGSFTLVYPKWIPGEHAPNGPIMDVTGLHFRADGKEIAWRRDEVDMFAFHCEIPTGVGILEASLDYLSPSETSGTEAPSASAQVAVLPWNLVVLYPQGAKSDDVKFAAKVQLPSGWKYATALEPATGTNRDSLEPAFETVSLTTLIDSPLLAGAFLKTYDLSPGQKPEHRISVAADSAAATALSKDQVQHLRQLVAETGALFGARHYRHYDFLLALSDHLQTNGLEHHESSDNRAPEKSFLDPDAFETIADLLQHEFFHSWNGKYRRPAGLATPNYQEPMRDSLLWVYEGLTQYYGTMLTARSGFWTPAQLRESLASTAAMLNDNRPGRTWRDLEDTAISSQVLYSARSGGASWRRAADYYDESTLVWLEADTIIRRESKGQKSLDDFCRSFHGTENGVVRVNPYTFQDVVAALNAIASYDWKKFLEERIHSHGPGAPLGGLEKSGWKLVYSEVMNDHERAEEETSHVSDFSWSLGFSAHAPGGDDANAVVDVTPGTPAAKAGLAPGMHLVAVNGRRWAPDVLRDALREAKTSNAPINLLVENQDYFQTVSLNYSGGDRHPHIEAASTPDILSEIAKHKAPEAK
jgi:predicted metalloprotease with PDZ domain